MKPADLKAGGALLADPEINLEDVARRLDISPATFADIPAAGSSMGLADYADRKGSRNALHKRYSKEASPICGESTHRRRSDARLARSLRRYGSALVTLLAVIVTYAIASR
ncbi:hypothetical protein [Rhizobium gallicum]|uniref:hypothetical protein n=1 Tax=Rhizobium gallicum TaxID=56730 RepID=UPI001EF94400|nr:hypothetical protein [Rhizobium gallicum]ULJ76156.1 hypothetical protein L2W42_27375 [Rhizobium gallicum]